MFTTVILFVLFSILYILAADSSWSLFDWYIDKLRSHKAYVRSSLMPEHLKHSIGIEIDRHITQVKILRWLGILPVINLILWGIIWSVKRNDKE